MKKSSDTKFRFDDLCIVRGKNAEGVELTAADAIQKKFADRSGEKVPLIKEGDSRRYRKNLIVLGTPATCDRLQKLKKPKHDGWEISVDNDNVTLLGGLPRGVLYAADHFLDSINITRTGFSIQKKCVREEPSFQTRLFLDYGMENPDFKLTDADLLRRHRYNACMMGIYTSNAILLKNSLPKVYRLVKNRARAEKFIQRERRRAQHLDIMRKNFDIDYYIYFTLGIPNHLRETVYKIYPDIKGVDHPDSYESAHICPSNPTSWKVWHSIVQEVFDLYPGATGIYLDIMHNGYGIYCQCEKCKASGLNTFPIELRKALLETYKVIKKNKKKLIYHTWTSGAKPRKGKSSGSDSGKPWHLPGDKPEWVFRQVIDWTPAEVELVKMDTWGDCLPTAPLDPIIGNTGKHPQVVQFQLAAEYRGFNKVPASMVQYLKDRMSVCAERNVSGVLSIIGGWMDPFYIFWKDIINSINYEAFAKLAWNVEMDVNEIWRSWAEKTFGAKAASSVIAALKLSQAVLEKSLAVKGINFNDHSGYPDSFARTWETTWDWSNYWYPDSHERFAPTPQNIIEIIAEKEEAISLVRKMLSHIGKARTKLRPAHYRELKERTDWLLYYVTIQRYLAEIYFCGYNLEEQAKLGKADVGQLKRIDHAVAEVKKALENLPAIAKKESYYQEMPHKSMPRYPIYPWLPSHSEGHPVRFANMLRDRAASICFRISCDGKMN